MLRALALPLVNSTMMTFPRGVGWGGGGVVIPPAQRRPTSRLVVMAIRASIGLV